ncbi:MAG TPA: hypothetical protein VIN03_27675 [Roseateles sp.]
MNPARPRSAPLLRSFWMGGYEGADHVNGRGEHLDMVAATGHAERLDADYRAARRLGLLCVRESVGWRLCEKPDGSWDLSRPIRMALAAQRQGVQILWTLMHYGVPPDLTLLDDALVPRFARFAAEVARVLKPLCLGPRFYTPINEISFLSWAASATGDMGPAGLQNAGAPEDSRISGYLLKQRLVRAALAGMAAIRAVDPEARFLHVEPVVHVAARDDDPEQRALARRIASYQWQALDMLAGRMDPGLGGHPDALDWIGVNHYHSSQWEVPGEKRLAWHLRDPRRQPLSSLLREVWRRYHRPMVLAETGHIGVGRADWLNEIAGEARRARAAGVPLQGICLYPLLDRPDWNDTRRWHRSGLWHLPTPQTRSLNRPFARALQDWRGLADSCTPPADERTGLLLLLPSSWEAWPAPREALLRKLGKHHLLRVLEPPRPGAAEPVLRCHALAPSAELLLLHGGATSRWADAPSPEHLALLRQAMQEAGPRRWICWLAGWRGDGHAGWWRELGAASLLVQPDPRSPPDAIPRATTLPPWPDPGIGRRPPPRCYEVDEVEQLLRGIPTPRLWLCAPAVLDDGEGLRALVAARPGWQVIVNAAAPSSSQPWPAGLHWLGRVHDSLHAALAAQVQAVLPWTALEGSGHGDAAGAEPLADMAQGPLQAVLQSQLGPPGQQPPQA